MSSIRSRQTGQVGSSTRDGVDVDVEVDPGTGGAGVKGSWESSGKLVFEGELGVWNVIDLMNLTSQISGCRKLASEGK